MRAAQINQYGGGEVIDVTDQATKPTPAAEQVLVEIRVVSLNPFDWKLREGLLKDNLPLKFPVTLAGDLAGIVAGVGEKVTKFHQGDEVYGSAHVAGGGSGALAEFAVTDADRLALRPVSIDFIAAAALPLVGVSAIQALEEELKLRPGQKILIHGGAGGIGSMTIQLAKHLGAYVATTVRGSDTKFASKLGADQVINYQTEAFDRLLTSFDAIFDTAGVPLVKSARVLSKGGKIVSMLGIDDEALLRQAGLTGTAMNTRINTARLDHLAALVDDGILLPQIDSSYPLTKIQDAFTKLETGSPQGKVVVEIKA
jgi:NADPH:quinone reductase-like Zn-dependent oxidoreductase